MVFQEREVECDDLVSDQFVNPGVAVNQHPRRHIIEAVHQTAELGWSHPLCQRGGAANVHKQQRQFNLGPATINSGNRLTIVAEPRVLPRPLPSQDGRNRTPEAMERRVAELTAGFAGKQLEPKSQMAQPRALPRQLRPPHLLRVWMCFHGNIRVDSMENVRVLGTLSGMGKV